jgi:inhibitor of KinA sporulation pathway (predicted exonuclease)
MKAFVEQREAEEAAANATSRATNARIAHIDTFHSYVRPTWRPQLSHFCTSLTGIEQSTVDASDTFPDVLLRLEAWMRRWGLLENDELKNAMWVTDGPWDLQDFVPKQLHITPTSPPRYPKYFLGRYLNIKEAVRTVRSEEERRKTLPHPDPSRITTARRAGRKGGAKPPLTITDQLAALGLSAFVGRQHSGIDDATNISRILQGIGARDVHIEPNATLSQTTARRYAWMGRPGEVLWNKPADPIGVEDSLAHLTLDDKEETANANAHRALTAICATS